jgi:hypothetical protein
MNRSFKVAPECLPWRPDYRLRALARRVADDPI